MPVRNLDLIKVCFRIYRPLKMPFCYFWNFEFSNLRMTLAKMLLCIETLNLKVKFHFRAAFRNW